MALKPPLKGKSPGKSPADQQVVISFYIYITRDHHVSPVYIYSTTSSPDDHQHIYFRKIRPSASSSAAGVHRRELVRRRWRPHLHGARPGVGSLMRYGARHGCSRGLPRNRGGGGRFARLAGAHRQGALYGDVVPTTVRGKCLLVLKQPLVSWRASRRGTSLLQ